MTTLINIFCLIGLIGIVVISIAFVHVVISTRPRKLTEKRREELLAKYGK